MTVHRINLTIYTSWCIIRNSLKFASFASYKNIFFNHYTLEYGNRKDHIQMNKRLYKTINMVMQCFLLISGVYTLTSMMHHYHGGTNLSVLDIIHFCTNIINTTKSIKLLVRKFKK